MSLLLWHFIDQLLATPYATRELIRESMIGLIEALTPTSHSSVPFRVERGERDFRAWGEANEAAALRRFSVRFVGQPSPPVVSDTQVELVEGDVVELVIAYPKQWGKYGEGNVRDFDDLMDEDLQQIDGRSGVGVNNAADWIAGQNQSLRVDWEIEDDEDAKVAFLRVRYQVDYYRSTAA